MLLLQYVKLWGRRGWTCNQNKEFKCPNCDTSQLALTSILFLCHTCGRAPETLRFHLCSRLHTCHQAPGKDPTSSGFWWVVQRRWLNCTLIRMTIKGLYKLCLGPGGSFRPERVPASRTGERDRWIQSRWIGTEVLSRVCMAASAELGEPASSPVSCLRGRTVVGSHLTDTPCFVSFVSRRLTRLSW